jgi:hypothetical protein
MIYATTKNFVTRNIRVSCAKAENIQSNLAIGNFRWWKKEAWLVSAAVPMMPEKSL